MTEKLTHEKAITAIREAHKKRAMYVYFIFKELEKELGRSKAEEITRRALKEAGKYYGSKMDSIKTPLNFIEKLEKDSHEDIFKRLVTMRDEHESTFVVGYCPLVNAWENYGLSKQDIALLCDIAMEADFGIMEALHFNMKLNKSLGRGDDRCIMNIKKQN